MGTDNELCAFSRLIFARSATGHPYFYVKPIFVGSKSVRRTKQNRKKKQNAIKCQSTWVWTVVVGTTNDGRPLVWVAVHLNCRGDPSLMLTSCQKKDFVTGLSIVRNIEDMHVLEWFGSLIFLVCFVSMVKTLFRNDLKTREI
jgi:hypothetical protein